MFRIVSSFLVITALVAGVSYAEPLPPIVWSDPGNNAGGPEGGEENSYAFAGIAYASGSDGGGTRMVFGAGTEIKLGDHVSVRLDVSSGNGRNAVPIR